MWLAKPFAVIAFTAENDAAQENELLALGTATCCSQPLKAELLGQTLERLIVS